jgi:hypothetical protein
MRQRVVESDHRAVAGGDEIGAEIARPHLPPGERQSDRLRTQSRGDVENRILAEERHEQLRLPAHALVPVGASCEVASR